MNICVINSTKRALVYCLICILAGASQKSEAQRVVAWGANQYGQAVVPAGLSNVTAVAAGSYHSLALKSDGTVVAWGKNSHGQSNVPDGLTNVVGIAAGENHSLAVTANGSVIGWGNNESGQAVPTNLSLAVAVAAGWNHSVALIADGTVIRWGGQNGPGGTPVPSDLNDVVAVAAGGDGSLALRRDGTVVAWGSQPAAPAGLSNVIAIAVSSGGPVTLMNDTTVVTWGSQPAAPAGLSNVVAISAGSGPVALRADGTVVTWGSQPAAPAGLSNAVAIAAGNGHTVSLVDNSLRPSIFVPPAGGRGYTGETFTFRMQARGSTPLYYQWRKDSVDLFAQTNSTLALNNLQFPDAGGYTVVVTNFIGATTSQVARLHIVTFGAPDIRADGVTLSENVIRGGQSLISMSTVFPNGTVFYTTDGSGPDFTSTPYQGSFVITQSSILRAVAFSADFTQSVEDGPFQIQIVPAYSLTKSADGVGIVAAFPNQNRYISGTTVTMYAKAGVGSRFVRWQGEACGTAADGAEVVMDADKVVTAVFERIPTYSLRVATTGGGTISGTAAGLYFESNVVTLTAQPAAGWQFLRWEGDVSGTTPSVAVTMDRAKSVQAVFGTAITTTVGGSGSLALLPSQGPYPYGSTVRISPRPSVDSYFAVWGSAASGRANPLAFVVTNANPTVSAFFAPLQGSDVNIYVTIEGGGTVSTTPNLQPYPLATPVTLTAAPLPGWRFVQWQGDASGTASNTTVVLSANKMATAVFEQLPGYALGATTVGGGFVLGNVGSPYAEGEVVHLTAQPATGWQFLGWEGDAIGTTPDLAVTMDRAKALQAKFGAASLLQNAVGPGNMSVVPAQGPYPYGSTVRIIATPNAGAYFASWGNAASGSENPLEFVVTTANPAVCALFIPGENIAPPSITAQPASQLIVVGGAATLRVTASGASPFAYQWRRDGVPIVGAVSSTVFLSAVTTNDAGAFDVVVSNAYGSITSAVATLTVVLPPSIAVHPWSQIVRAETATVLSVVATGTDPFSYQWLNATGPIPSATNASYAIESTSTNEAGAYFVIVSNPYGSVTSQKATLTVYVPVTITLAPSRQVTPFRGTAVFTVSADGFPSPAYQWVFNGDPIPGANDKNLVITNVGTNDLGSYTAVVWNAYSAATSGVARLLMAPSIRSPFLGSTVVWGKSATISIYAIGSGELTYQWFKDGAAIPWVTGANLDFPAVQLTDAGLYSVVVRSEWGSVTNTPAQLVVNPANISLAMYAGVTIDGVPGFTYGIQSSTDLRNTNSWVTVTNYTLTLPMETWIDFGSTGRVKRFYRVVVP